MSTKKWLVPLSEFAVRTFVSSAIYVAIVVPALLVFALVRLAESLSASVFLVRTFRFLEYVVVSVDAIFLLVYLANDLKNSSWRHGNESLSRAHGHRR
jgi:hypothetical protein